MLPLLFITLSIAAAQAQKLGAQGWNTSITTKLFDTKLAPIIPITVGVAGTLAFSPSSVNASAGTVLRFDFLGLNHTLTQSSFANPCTNSTSDGAFDTGFNQFNPGNISGRFVVDYVVMSDAPQWFFCAQTKQKSHCNAGMVFSLNPGSAASQF